MGGDLSFILAQSYRQINIVNILTGCRKARGINLGKLI